MMPQNAPKWLLMLAVAAAWTLAAGEQLCAQARRNAVDAPRPPGSAQVSDAREEPFDSTITVPELLEKAREAFGLEKHGLAEKFYQAILIRERSNVQAMVELANVYERSGKLEYARGLLVRSAKLDPGNESIAQRLAAVERVLVVVLSEEVDSLIASTQYELAIPKLSVHTSIEPDNPELLYKRALCYSRLGRADAALTSINAALRIEQKEKYYKLRAAILEELKEQTSREMVAEAKRLIKSNDPQEHRRALELIAEILQSEPEHEWANAEFLRLSNLGKPREAGAEDGPSFPRGILAFMSKIARTAGEVVRYHLSAILVLITALVLFQSPLTKLITRVISPRAFLSGRFPRFTLTEILVMLNSESHTGILHVKGESCRGKVYIANGEPCHCVVGKLTGVDALHHLLSYTKAGHFEFGGGSIPLKRTMDTPLSVVLVEHASGGPRGAGRPTGGGSGPKKAKSRMKELLESKSGK
jgi:tetratricopeptide (TPR) repeat protein